ncbi:MAG: hypothetical protein ACAI44_11140 [Candidatus Sericytochromatia bacterium]
MQRARIKGSVLSLAKRRGVLCGKVLLGLLLIIALPCQAVSPLESKVIATYYHPEEILVTQAPGFVLRSMGLRWENRSRPMLILTYQKALQPEKGLTLNDQRFEIFLADKPGLGGSGACSPSYQELKIPNQNLGAFRVCVSVHPFEIHGNRIGEKSQILKLLSGNAVIINPKANIFLYISFTGVKASDLAIFLKSLAPLKRQ